MKTKRKLTHHRKALLLKEINSKKMKTWTQAVLLTGVLVTKTLIMARQNVFQTKVEAGTDVVRNFTILMISRSSSLILTIYCQHHVFFNYNHNLATIQYNLMYHVCRYNRSTRSQSLRKKNFLTTIRKNNKSTTDILQTMSFSNKNRSLEMCVPYQFTTKLAKVLSKE